MTILTQAAECFTKARKNLIHGAALLWAIEASKSWEGKYGSFSEYVEQECQISKSFAAKLVAIHGYYIETHKLEPKQLESADSEKLYMAIGLKLAPDAQLLRARTWTRGEMRNELHEQQHGSCDHSGPFTSFHRCQDCGKFYQV